MTNNTYHIQEPYPGWLDEAVDTHEASRLTGVPTATLITMRSKGGGPHFIRPQHTRLVRYFRRSLMEWLLSTGLHSSTSFEMPGPAALIAQNDNEEGE